MKIYNYIEFIKESSDMAIGTVGYKKFKVTGYRTWDEARPEGIVEADSKEDIENNFKSYEQTLMRQDSAFEGADLDTIEEIPNNS